MTAEIVRVFALIAVFAAIFLVVQYAGSSYARSHTYKGAVNRRLKMISQGQDREAVVGQLIKNRPGAGNEIPGFMGAMVDKLERMLFAANAPFRVGQMMIFMAIGMIGLFLIIMLSAAFFGGALNAGTVLIAGIFSVAVAIGLPLLILGKMAESRRKKMEHQFPVALDIFVRALRSGHPIASAIDLLTKEMDDPIGSEFGLISDEISYGADLIGALENMADRWDLDDMKMFVVSLSVQSQTGGNLAEILDNISKVIRDRHSMFMKVKALSSEGRMTAWMLTALPIFGFVSIFLLTPQYYMESADDPIFVYGAITLLIMYALGVYVIRRLVDLKV